MQESDSNIFSKLSIFWWKNLGGEGLRPDLETSQGVVFFNSSESVLRVKNGRVWHLSQKKLFFFIEGFPNDFNKILNGGKFQ